jgi:hypothetical protein
MNISSIGGAGGATAIGANQNDFRTRMQQSMAPVAQLFGMTSDQLMSAVKDSGKSLADYASSKGISNADLTAAVKQGLQSNAPSGAQLSDTQLTNLAQRIENHKPGDRPQGPPPGGAIGGATSTDSTSLLKSEVEKLLDELKASATSSTSSSGLSSTTKTDLEKLIADLRAANADASRGGTTNNSRASGSVSTNALIDVLTRFDQQL